jgi:hypothetical protein
MVIATSLEFIKDLSQYHYNDKFYDFHNDYDCEKIIYQNNILLILLKNIHNGTLLSLNFIDTKIVFVDFFNKKEVSHLTIDSLYRGRAEFNGNIIEVSEDESGYFYLEFYEGQKLEFWAKGIIVE